MRSTGCLDWATGLGLRGAAITTCINEQDQICLCGLAERERERERGGACVNHAPAGGGLWHMDVVSDDVVYSV